MWRRALRLVRPDPVRDVDEEFAFHLAMREAEYRARGESEDAARLHAHERFGDLKEARQACVMVDTRIHKAAHRMRVIEELGQDLRFAGRSLRKNPGFAAAVIITLAVGIGATTAIFAVLNGVLLRPPAQVRRPTELVTIFTSDFSGPLYGGSSHPDYESFREATDVFSGVAALDQTSVSITLRGATQVHDAQVVSGNFFEVLGTPMQVGRPLLASEDGEPGAHPVAVISDQLWRRTADADPGVVGQPITINNHVFTVVGVAAPRFTGAGGGRNIDLWVPRSMMVELGGGLTDLTGRDNRGITILARLRPGVTREAAQARLDAMARQLFAQWPAQWRDVTGAGRRISVLEEKYSRLEPDMRGRVVGFFAVLMGAVTLLLLLCSANVATLFVARGAARGREVAVRLSMGAGRGRLVRQLMTENMLLALLGGGAGLWVAGQVTRLLLAMLKAEAGDIDTRLQGIVLVFALGVTIGAGLLCGLAPSLRASRADPNQALKGASGTAMLGRRRVALRDLLVTVQVALSLVLLAGAGLLLRSVHNMQRVDVGFENQRMVIAWPSLGLAGYDSARAREYYRTAEERIAGLPGVGAVTIARAVALGGGMSRTSITIEGYERRPGEDMEFGVNTVEPGYFRLMGIELAMGRDFAPTDREGAPGAAIVNETFARRFWPNESPLGHRFQRGRLPMFTVVGVSRDIDYARVGEESRPFFYLPYAQAPVLHMALHVRTTGDDVPVMAAVKAVLKEIDPTVPASLSTIEERLASQLMPQRTAATMLMMLAVVGLLLAATGLYGVLAFSVTQRTREFGIRMALGASAGRVKRMVVRQGVVLAAVGVVVGLGAAFMVTRVAASLLFGVEPTDPLTFGSVVAVLIVVAALASWVPARRVTAVNPADVIRAD